MDITEPDLSVVEQFTDSEAIPEDMKEYVALAVQNGLIEGFTDGSFRPNAPVNRAQMAALLDRSQGDNERVRLGFRRDGFVKGEFVGFDSQEDPTEIIVKVEEEEEDGDEGTTTATESYPLVEDPVVYLKGREAELLDLRPGDRVDLGFNEDEEVDVIFAQYERMEIKCKVLGVDGTTLTVKISEVDDVLPEYEDEYTEGATVDISVDEDTVVKYRGGSYVFEEGLIEQDDLLEIKFHGDEVETIVLDEDASQEAEEDEEAEIVEFEGVVDALDTEEGWIQIAVEDDGETDVVTLLISTSDEDDADFTTEIYIDGEEATLEDLVEALGDDTVVEAEASVNEDDGETEYWALKLEIETEE